MEGRLLIKDVREQKQRLDLWVEKGSSSRDISWVAIREDLKKSFTYYLEPYKDDPYKFKKMENYGSYCR